MAFDAILIPGGGVREGGELPPWAKARLDLALELGTTEPLVCLSAGTPHRPPPLESGFPIAESVAGARYLMQKGIISTRLRVENASFDTIGNAYLSKLLHVDPPGWHRLLVITSEFHMPRVRAVFEWIYGFEPDRYQLAFEAAPNTGCTAENLKFRQAKEEQSLISLRSLQQKLRSLREFHEWFFTEHDAYSAAGRPRNSQKQDETLLESY